MANEREAAVMLCAVYPRRYERVLSAIVAWGYDTKRYDGMSDVEIVASNLPDTTGVRCWLGDKADNLRIASWHRRAARGDC